VEDLQNFERKDRMAIILKDMINKGKITRLESCKYCLDAKGRPKPIWPDDMKHTRKMEDGSYMCGVCQIEMLLKLNNSQVGLSKLL